MSMSVEYKIREFIKKIQEEDEVHLMVGIFEDKKEVRKYAENSGNYNINWLTVSNYFDSIEEIIDFVNIMVK